MRENTTITYEFDPAIYQDFRRRWSQHLREQKQALRRQKLERVLNPA